MSAAFTVEEFTAAMEAAVAERGEDWTYPKREEAPAWWSDRYCRYVLGNGAPACLIGLALSKLIPNEDIPRTNVGAPDALQSILGGDVDAGLADAAENAQWAQDQGLTWGEALDAYKRTLGLS